MRPRLPSPLAPGAVIGVTAPSSGVGPALRPRFDFCRAHVEARGFRVRTGDCLFGDGITSAPAPARAAELEAMLTDPAIDAVLPPWGGELAIELLPRLDFARLAASPPKWLASWSDGTTLMLPLLLRAGWMSLHGLNLMDASFTPPPGVAPWWEILRAAPGTSVAQSSIGRLQRAFRDYRHEPALTDWLLQEPSRPVRLGSDAPFEAGGRLLVGCADVVSRLVGTPYGDVPGWVRAHSPDGTVVVLENCGMPAEDAARCWHQLILAGWLDRANAVLIGRTTAPETDAYTQRAAVEDAFAPLLERGVPVVVDGDVGHQPPQWMLVMGAETRVRYASGRAEVVQTLR